MRSTIMLMQSQIINQARFNDRFMLDQSKERIRFMISLVSANSTKVDIEAFTRLRLVVYGYLYIYTKS